MLAIACSACADDYVIKVGLTEGPQGALELTVPERAKVGEAVELTVRTIGGGCISEYDTQVTITRDDALIVPRDETYVGGDTACVAAIFFYRHRATIVFDTPGMKTLRVQGRKGSLTWPWEPDDTILLEYHRPFVVE